MLASPNSKTPVESRLDMQYENLENPIWETKDKEPRFIPKSPVVFESSSWLELEPESMHPNTTPARSEFVNRKVSEARLPSTEVASA